MQTASRNTSRSCGKSSGAASGVTTLLIETTADPEPEENRPKYRLLATVARWLGPRPVASRVMPILFGRTFLTDPARAAERARWRRELLGNQLATLVELVAHFRQLHPGEVGAEYHCQQGAGQQRKHQHAATNT